MSFCSYTVNLHNTWEDTGYMTCIMLDGQMCYNVSSCMYVTCIPWLNYSKSKKEGECHSIVLYNTVASPDSCFTGCSWCMIKSDCTGTFGCIKLMEVYIILQTADSSVMGTIPCRQSMYMYQHTCHWLCQCSKSACCGVQVSLDAQGKRKFIILLFYRLLIVV